MLYFRTYHEIIFKRTKKFKLRSEAKKIFKKKQTSWRNLRKYNELTKYSRRRISDKEIEDEYLKSLLEQTIAERVKLMPEKETGTGIKILTPNELSTKLPVLLVQLKHANNSCKLDIYYAFPISIIKSTKYFTRN